MVRRGEKFSNRHKKRTVLRCLLRCLEPNQPRAPLAQPPLLELYGGVYGVPE